MARKSDEKCHRLTLDITSHLTLKRACLSIFAIVASKSLNIFLISKKVIS